MTCGIHELVRLLVDPDDELKARVWYTHNRPQKACPFLVVMGGELEAGRNGMVVRDPFGAARPYPSCQSLQMWTVHLKSLAFSSSMQAKAQK